jgi:putative transposase
MSSFWLGPDYTYQLKRRQGQLGNHRYPNEVFIRINGQQQYLWRSIKTATSSTFLVQPRRDRRAAERFFRRLVRGQKREPLRITTDRLKSYSAAIRTVLDNTNQSSNRYANNRMEVSHQATRQRDGRCAVKSAMQAQCFFSSMA